MTTSIRRAHGTDIPELMDISLKTGDDGKDGSALYSDPWFIGHRYVFPYVMHSLELCLVAESNARPKGYIVGCADTVAFYAWLEDAWLPPLRRRYPLDMPCASETEAFFLRILHDDKRSVVPPEGYPAHLHINLLPEIRRHGVGKALVTRFLDGLTKRRCPGVHLHVGAQNRGAVSFYAAQGFSVLKESPSVLLLGRRLID